MLIFVVAMGSEAEWQLNFVGIRDWITHRLRLRLLSATSYQLSPSYWLSFSGAWTAKISFGYFKVLQVNFNFFCPLHYFYWLSLHWFLFLLVLWFFYNFKIYWFFLLYFKISKLIYFIVWKEKDTKIMRKSKFIKLKKTSIRFGLA